MKILVTGGSGFIGSEVLKFADEILISDVTNKEKLRQELLQKKGEGKYLVVHCAAKTDVDWCEKNYKDAIKVNVHGTSNLSDAICDKGRMVFLSSCHVYSGDKYFPYTEKHTPNPVNAYGMTKFGAEASLGHLDNVLSLRIGKIYNDSTIESILDPIKCEEKIPSFIYRNFIHMDDFLSVLSHFLGTSWSSIGRGSKNFMPKTVNVGNPLQNFSYHQFYNLVAEKAGFRFSARDRELGYFSPRPFRCKLSVKRQMSLLPSNFKFRSL